MIAGKTWKLGNPIHSTGVGAVKKKKMVETFGAESATAKADWVLMGLGSGHKYRVKWTNLLEEHICNHWANHQLVQDLSKEQPPKVSKIHGPQRLSPYRATSSCACANTSDALEFYLSSGEISDADHDHDDQQFPGISPLPISNTVSRMNPSFYCLDPLFLGELSSYITFIAFVEYIWA